MRIVVQGTGKSLLGYCMKRVYGTNFAEIRDQDLQGSFAAMHELRLTYAANTEQASCS